MDGWMDGWMGRRMDRKFSLLSRRTKRYHCWIGGQKDGLKSFIAGWMGAWVEGWSFVLA